MGYSAAVKYQVVKEYLMWEHIYGPLLGKKKRKIMKLTAGNNFYIDIGGWVTGDAALPSHP